MCGSMLAMMIAVLLRNSADDEDMHDSFDDLEKALGRISDTDSKEDGSDEEVSHQDDDQHRKPPAATSLSSTSIKKKEEPAVTADEALPAEGDHKEPQQDPVTEGNPLSAPELETIKEEG